MKTNTENMFFCPHCGKQHSIKERTCPLTGEDIPEHHKLIGKILEGKYAIKRIIGEGGMGIVFEAKHTLIGRRLAVKVLFPEIASNQEIVERFYNEARTAAAIGHDHIIEITDMGSYDKSPFIVMEYLDGVSLSGYIEERMLSIDDATGIIIQVLDALNAVHAKGVIHRDLKPDNIFLIEKSGKANFVKILDFGISKLKTPQAQDMALTRTGTVLGTPYYMAPEQAAGKKEQDHRIDIYAAGVILYEMLTGQLPFSGDNYNALIAAILTEEAPRPTIYNPNIPQEVENVIMTAIAKQPTQRYSNALNFMEAIKPFAPAWAMRPSRVPGLTSTAIGASGGAPPPVATQTPPPGMPPPAMGGPTGPPTEQSMSGTADWSIPDGDEAKGRGKTLYIVGAVVVVLLLVAGGLGLAFGPKLLGGGDRTGDEKKISKSIEPLVKGKGKGGPADVKPDEEKKPDTPNPADSGEKGKGAPKDVSLKLVGLPDGAIVSLGGKKVEGNPSRVAYSAEEKELRVEAEGYVQWVAKKTPSSDLVVEVAMVGAPEVKGGKKKKKGKQDEEKPPASGTIKPPVIVVEKQPEIKPVKKKEKGKSGTYKGKVKLSDIDYPD
ncbi:MAG: serine/threonine-protein kinase [Pseudomonadota bacterium]